MKFFNKLEAPAYAALRIVAGFMFACHGMQKMLGWFGGKAAPEFMSQIWVGGVIELVGGLLIAVGLGTRIAAFICSGTMAVAYFQFHMKGQWSGTGLLPIVNGGEMAMLYALVFLFITGRGPGMLAADNVVSRRG